MVTSPNTYEAPICQETHRPYERIFAFFPPWDSWHSQQTVSCSDVISV
jgi:hypothetical protein